MDLSKIIEHELHFYDTYLSENNLTHDKIELICKLTLLNNNYDKISLTFEWFPSEKLQDSLINLKNHRINPFSKFEGEYINYMNGFNIAKNKITIELLNTLLMSDEEILSIENKDKKKYKFNKFVQNYRERIIFSLIQWKV